MNLIEGTVQEFLDQDNTYSLRLWKYLVCSIWEKTAKNSVIKLVFTEYQSCWGLFKGNGHILKEFSFFTPNLKEI